MLRGPAGTKLEASVELKTSRIGYSEFFRWLLPFLIRFIIALFNKTIATAVTANS